MEWNSRTPLQWDLENLIMFNSQATGNLKKILSTNLAIDGEEGINAWKYSSGGGGGVSDSELAMALSSKISKSASTNSSSTGKLKSSRFSFQAFEVIAEDPSHRKVYTEAKPTGTSPMLEASVASGEPLLGLKLAKRSKVNYQTTLDQHCQVEGCNLDLSSAKDYHRKHRICESHSKCPKVIVDGLERRFCQQCSRFHALSEFDEKKRSCRRRLLDHNARRRKLQKAAFRLNPVNISSSPCDRRQTINPIWSSMPLVHTKPHAYFTCESTNDCKLLQTSASVLKPGKEGAIDGQLLFPSPEQPHYVTTLFHDSNSLFQSKGTTTEFLNQGLEESLNISALDETQEFCRALCLLSTNTWGSCDPKPISLHRPVCTNHDNMSQPLMPAVPLSLPLASSEDWQSEPQPTKSQVHTFRSHSDGSIHFEEFQLFRSPYESGYYSVN